MIAIVQILRVGEPVRTVMNEPVPPSLKMEDLVYAYQLLRARNREQPQRQAVQDRENADVDSNAQRDRHYGRDGETRAMGRPREFDADAAVEAAMRVFWEKGYDGATLSDLTSAMGINRSSMYTIFGDKEALFRKAIDRYADGNGGVREKVC